MSGHPGLPTRSPEYEPEKSPTKFGGGGGGGDGGGGGGGQNLPTWTETLWPFARSSFGLGFWSRTTPTFVRAAQAVAVTSEVGQPAFLRAARASAVVRPVSFGTLQAPVAAGEPATEKAATLAATAARTPSARMLEL